MKDKNMNMSCSAGESIEAWCPNCKGRSSHTIISVVDNVPKKIKCDICDEHHKLSDKPSVKSQTKSKSAPRKTLSKETTYEEYLTRLAGGDPANSRKYDTHGDFKKDEVIEHLKFGIGIVLSVIESKKVKILFKDGPKLLIQNQ